MGFVVHQAALWQVILANHFTDYSPLINIHHVEMV
jgi:hypothetical protein